MLIKKAKLKGKLGQDIDHLRNLDTASLAEADLSIAHEDPELDIPKEELDVVGLKIEKMISESKSRIDSEEQEARVQIQKHLEDAKNEASAIIHESELKKQEIDHYVQEQKQKIETEKTELANLMQAEKQKAYGEGFAKGQEHVDQLKQILNSFQNIKFDFLKSAEREIAAIAIDVVKQILARESEENSDLILEQVNKSIAKVVTGKGKVQIFVNPEDLKYAESHKEEIAKTLDSGVELIILGDAQIDKASCIIETKGGRFDASFKTQLELIQVAFSKYLGYKIGDLNQKAGHNDGEMQRDEPKFNSFFEPSDDMIASTEVLDSEEILDADEMLQALEEDKEPALDADIVPDIDYEAESESEKEASSSEDPEAVSFEEDTLNIDGDVEDDDYQDMSGEYQDPNY